MDAQIRLLTPADAAALFTLRRESLCDSPSAFLASPDDDLASSPESVRGLLEGGSLVYGAFTDTLQGLLGLNRARPAKAAHKVMLWGMFVRPAARGRGLGARLLVAAVAHARTLPGVASVHLSVSDSAQAARRLYERAGFRVWGTEPAAIHVDGRFLCEHHLALDLTPGGPGETPAR